LYIRAEPERHAGPGSERVSSGSGLGLGLRTLTERIREELVAVANFDVLVPGLDWGQGLLDFARVAVSRCELRGRRVRDAEGRLCAASSGAVRSAQWVGGGTEQTHVGDAFSQADPLALVAAQEAQGHAQIEPTEQHTAPYT
jgi:hypothetical protein